MIVLREFQVDMIQECRQAIMAGHRAICLVASTGAGKTVIGRIGTCLGNNQGNISEMDNGRDAGGGRAMTILSIWLSLL